YRRCIAIDETELKVEKTIVYVWSTVDVDSKKLLTLEASYCRSCLNTLKFIKKEGEDSSIPQQAKPPQPHSIF
ncbi:MAG: hypothetical protein QXU63_05715, partial [Nitrososphaerota archaeon]